MKYIEGQKDFEIQLLIWKKRKHNPLSLKSFSIKITYIKIESWFFFWGLYGAVKMKIEEMKKKNEKWRNKEKWEEIK
jgi:hypothetical protein